MVIHGRLDTRVETRCPGGFSISCFASRSRHFSYSEIEFYFQVLVKFSLYHAKKSLPVYLYINLLFQIITLLALDNLSEFELVTIVITGYMLRYGTPELPYSIQIHLRYVEMFIILCGHVITLCGHVIILCRHVIV